MALFGVTVEVPLFLSFFSFMLSGSVYTNLIIYRTCYLSLGYNKTECALLGTVYNNDTEKLEKLVEPDAAVVNMVRSTIESLFSVLLCFFVGPWSDKFGRKPVIILNLIGTTVSFVLLSIFSFFENMSPWYSIVCSVPGLVTGGGAAYITVILSYITDITNNETRGIRMAVFEAVLAGGILVGNISGSYLFYATNYVWVFTISTGICGLGLLYTIFFIPESVQNPETQGKIRGFFDISNLGDMVKTTFKRREYFIRSIILLNLLILTIHIFIMNGDGSIMFLYLREKFDWTLTKFTLFNSATSVVWIIGTMGGTYILHKLCNIKEAALILVGLISTTAGSLLQGFGKADWYLYTAGGVRCLGGVISPMSRSLISKLIPDDEIGKIFSMIMASEFLIGLGASPLYTAIYNGTINSDPAFFNYLSAGLFAVNMILTVTIIILQQINPIRYSELNSEDQESCEVDHIIN
ncbi:proton-coupled folate transporter isoform X2 [Anoplophora glabripennis]|nr:proton-coupled folate transporter isoform X2 [Anoplophora glabripennis]